MSRNLFEKTRGPNALPVSQLVSQADDAIAAVKKDYPSFLHSLLPTLDAMLDEGAKAPSAESWEPLKAAAYELRSSSATAGYDQISEVAGSLEWVLTAALEKDERVTEVVRLHLQALHRLVDDGSVYMDQPEIQQMLSDLARAGNQVTRPRRF